MENQPEQQTFLIEEAAAYIGINRRTLERDDRIASRYERREGGDGKMRKMRVYDRTELDRAREQLYQVKHSGALVAPIAGMPELKQFAELLVGGMREELQNFLSQVNSPLQLAAAPDENRGDTPKHKKIDIASFKDKLILSFPQAQAISGLPSGVLKSALDENKIKFKKVGRRRYVQKESLEEFCRDYFAE